MIRWSQNKVYFNLFLCCLGEVHDWGTYDSPMWRKWTNTMNFSFFQLLALFTKEKFYLPQKKYTQIKYSRKHHENNNIETKGSFLFRNGFICALKTELGKKQLIFAFQILCFDWATVNLNQPWQILTRINTVKADSMSQSFWPKHMVLENNVSSSGDLV